MKKQTRISSRSSQTKDPSPYPKGWNRQRAQKLIEYYDRQTDDEAIAEAEAAYGNKATTMMQIPNHLVSKVQKLIAKRAG